MADPRPQVLEGDWPHEKVVLIEFADQAEAHRWARSDAYVAIAADRRAAATATVLTLRSAGGAAASRTAAGPAEAPPASPR